MIAAMDGLRVVFMGTPGFAIPAAEVICRLGCHLVAVYSAPDRPVGRGRRVTPSPVKEWALGRRIPVYAPSRLSLAEERERFEALRADLVVLAAYGLLLPPVFLFGPTHGAVNVHPSLLPRHRGAAPVAAAILHGDRVTGVSVMVMDEGLDTGPVIAQRAVDLHGKERTPELTARLFALGAGLLGECLPEYVAGRHAPQPQPEEGVTVTRRFRKDDGVVEWFRPAEELERMVRALDPWPGVATSWQGKRLEITEADVVPGARHELPGTVVEAGDGAAVVTGRGLLVLRRVKLEGRPATGVGEFLRGHRAFLGSVLPS